MALKVTALFVLIAASNIGKDVSGLNGARKRIKALTYNTGLFDYSKISDIPNNRQQRLQGTIEELRKSNADIVCLQEVWIGQDLEAIVNQLNSVFAYSYSPLHNADGSLPSQSNLLGRDAPCSRQALIDLNICVITKGCSNPDRATELQCTTVNCQQELFTAFSDQDCVTCIAITGSNATEIIEKCSSDVSPAVNPRTINSKGLALLSKKPLFDRQSYGFYDNFPIKLIDRGYISAKLTDDLTIICTHLTSVPEVLPPPSSGEPVLSSQFPSYADQNIFEVDMLVEKYREVTPLILLGDFNIAKSFHKGLASILSRTYRKLAQAFEDHVPATECTFCAGHINPYNEGETSKAIDHVFGNDLRIVGAQVLFKNVTFVDGVGRELPLSDHFGFESIFDYPRCCKTLNLY